MTNQKFLKKQLGLLIVAAISVQLLLGGLTAFAAAQALYYDFATDPGSTKWTLTTSTGNTATYNNGTETSLALTRTATAGTLQASSNFANDGGVLTGGANQTVIVETAFKKNSTDKLNIYIQNVPIGGSTCRLEQTSASAFRVVTGTPDSIGTTVNTDISSKIIANDWNKVKFKINYNTRRVSIWVNDFTVITDGGFMGTYAPTSLKTILFQHNGTALNSKVELAYLSAYNDDDESSVAIAQKYLTLGDISAVANNITLPSSGLNDTSITWQSSDTGVISNTGVITRPMVDTAVTLTATITKGAYTQTKEFVATVLQGLTAEDSVAQDISALTLSGITALTSNLSLPSSGSNGTSIQWSSNGEKYLNSNGIINRPSAVESDANVQLTATISKGTASGTKVFDATVKKLDYVSNVDFSETLTDWRFRYSATENYLDAIVNESGNDYVKLTSPVSNLRLIEMFSPSFSSIITNTDKIAVEIEFNSQTELANVFYVQSPEGGSSTRIIQRGNNLVSQYKENSISKEIILTSNLQRNVWYNLRVELDYSTQKFNVYLNNALKGSNLTFLYSATRLLNTISQLTVPTIQPSNDISISFDNFKVYRMTDSLAVKRDALCLDIGDTTINNIVGIGTTGGNGSTLNCTISDSAVSSGGIVTRPNYNQQDIPISITIIATKNGFTETKTYHTTLLKKTTFIELLNNSEVVGDALITRTMTVKNYNPIMQNIVLALATYDNGQLLGIDYKEISLNENEESQVMTFETLKSSTSSVKFFLWNNIQIPYQQ